MKIKSITSITILFLYLAQAACLGKPGTYFLAKLSGKFSVSKARLFLQDSARKDPYLNLDYRPLLIDIYYPTDESHEQKCSYSHRSGAIIQKECKDFLHIDKLNDILLNTKAQSFSHLPISKKKELYPIILFSHGYTHSSESNSAQCEDLASHGFFVIAINHTGISGNSQFSDENYLHECLAPRSLETPLHMCNDINFITNYLHQHAQKINWLKKADVKRIGIFGHSLGGMAATRCSALNRHIKAGINLDGPLFGRTMFPVFYKPFLFLLAEDFEARFSQDHQALNAVNITPKTFQESIPSLITEMKGFGKQIIIKGTSHNSFCDHLLIHHTFSEVYPDLALSLQKILLLGTANGQEAHQIILQHLISFFKKNL